MKDPAREIQQLRTVLDVARYMAVTNDLDVLLGAIVEATCDVLACERATIFLYDSRTDELYSRVAKGMDAFRFPADRGIAGAVAKERICVIVPDAYADPRFNPEVDRKSGFRTRNLLTVPLENLQGELIGVLQALNKTGGCFASDDEELARVLSAQAGVALDRARLIEEYAEKQRMQRDLQLARSIQQAYLPKRNPDVPGYDVAGWNQSADETGGDCYDFIPVADGKLAVLMADATGHGIGAALIIAQARSLVRAMLTITDDLARIGPAVNSLLCQDLASGDFVTAFVGILDPQRHVIEYISAGQGPVLTVSAAGVANHLPNALPFGVMPEVAHNQPVRFEFAPGAMLALLTDGFFETADARGDLFGEARIGELLQRSGGATLEQTITRLHDATRAFAGEQPQMDDLTAVLIRRRPG